MHTLITGGNVTSLQEGLDRRGAECGCRLYN
jgi:hypothetical protein